MGRKGHVIGQTGRVVLSDEAIQYKLSKKRTVRYNYQKVQHGFMCYVVGPFFSRCYGACSFGTKKASAKVALQHRLACSYNYLGQMMFSDVDEADTIGRSQTELWGCLNNKQKEEWSHIQNHSVPIKEDYPHKVIRRKHRSEKADQAWIESLIKGQ
jgi:hypothetical protein